MLRQNEISLSSRALIELIRSTLLKGASFRFQVKGRSMSPFIRDGDIAVISPFRDYSASFGRVAAFVRPRSEKLVIHRIIGKNKKYFFLKGDGLFGVDGLIPETSILGVITAIERNGKQVTLGLGPERVIIGLLSRLKVLSFFFLIWKFVPHGLRRFIKCGIRF